MSHLRYQLQSRYRRENSNSTRRRRENSRRRRRERAAAALEAEKRIIRQAVSTQTTPLVAPQPRRPVVPMLLRQRSYQHFDGEVVPKSKTPTPSPVLGDRSNTPLEAPMF